MRLALEPDVATAQAHSGSPVSASQVPGCASSVSRLTVSTPAHELDPTIRFGCSVGTCRCTACGSIGQTNSPAARAPNSAALTRLSLRLWIEPHSLGPNQRLFK